MVGGGMNMNISTHWVTILCTGTTTAAGAAPWKLPQAVACHTQRRMIHCQCPQLHCWLSYSQQLVTDAV